MSAPVRTELRSTLLCAPPRWVINGIGHRTTFRKTHATGRYEINNPNNRTINPALCRSALKSVAKTKKPRAKPGQVYAETQVQLSRVGTINELVS